MGLRQFWNPISSSDYKGLNHFFCSYIYSNEIQRHKNYRIMLSRNHWKALFTMVWGWLFSSVIWREEKFWFVRFVPKVRTLDFPSVFNGFRTNWDFRNMIESITTIRNRHRIKAKLLISLYFTKVKWYFIPFIYTVMDKKSKS